MAKSMRSKKLKRLRAIRREMVEPLYEKKELAKYAAMEAALAAPKLPVKPIPNAESSMELVPTTSAATITTNTMDVDMDDNSKTKDSLKAIGGVGKMSKRQFKVGKRKRPGKGKGKGKVKRRHI
ncbi:uncharacterized protein LOC115697715 [Cannabis sativa]|uniref:Uncharacterized protein n=2 Tax=Cannabis sativa TaxID=3483 RepID=A0AB40EC24_CANSA|nr:uncharacterized protein LOC115697715 [Cannabis sativa]KAF4347321.1 hypothetical protein G4B88_007804 [Cannabis sativa]KAF4381279.1 hypothetical protein F8388_016235 [Cannabis sativa]KAF4391410.1 hypothetical protein F8388_008021 [Cannabis sativa]